MIIVILIIIALLLYGILGAVTARSRAEEKARRKELSRKEIADNPERHWATVLLLGAALIVVVIGAALEAPFGPLVGWTTGLFMVGWIIIQFAFDKSKGHIAAATTASGNLDLFNKEGEAWPELSPHQRRSIVERALATVRVMCAGSLTKLRRTDEYVDEIEREYQLHAAKSNAAFQLSDVLLEIVRADNVDDPNIASTISDLQDLKSIYGSHKG